MFQKNRKAAKYKTKEIKIFNLFYAKRIAIIVAVFLFVLFFFFINSNNMIDEHAIVNVWIKKSDVYGEPFRDTSLEIAGNFSLDFFIMSGKFVHYFDKNGYSVSYRTLENNQLASGNNNNYIIYTKFGLNVNSFDKFGTALWNTNMSAYPRAASFANIISLYSSENSSFTLVDWDNNILTDGSRRYGEYITDSVFAKETGDFVAGYIDGNIIMYYRTGQPAFKIIPMISDINVCKGVAITEKGSFVSAVTGIGDEYLSVYDAFGNLMWNVKTGGDARKNVYIGMSQYTMTVSMLGENQINIYNLIDGKLKTSLDLTQYDIGDIKYMKHDASGDNILFSFSSANKSIIILYNAKTNSIIWSRILDEQTYDINISTSNDEYLIITKNYMYAFKRIKI